MVASKTECYVCEETEQEQEAHDAAYQVYKLLYYILIILGTVLFLVLVDVALLKDHSMRQTMFYMALAVIVLMVSERILDHMLKKWGVIA